MTQKEIQKAVDAYLATRYLPSLISQEVKKAMEEKMSNPLADAIKAILPKECNSWYVEKLLALIFESNQQVVAEEREQKEFWRRKNHTNKQLVIRWKTECLKLRELYSQHLDSLKGDK